MKAEELLRRLVTQLEESSRLEQELADLEARFQRKMIVLEESGEEMRRAIDKL